MDITGLIPGTGLDPIPALFLQALQAEAVNLRDTLIGHLQVGVNTESVNIGEVLYVDFIVDGITRGVLKAAPYNIASTVLDQYKFSSYNDLAEDDRHLVYSLNHQSCTINWNNQNLIGTITIDDLDTPTPVELYVRKLSAAPAPGKKPPKGGPGPEHVALGTVSFPFEYTTGRAADLPGPGKYKRLSVLWGDIKSQ